MGEITHTVDKIVVDIINFPWTSRCCCGRPENKHGKLTTVQEENEEAEVASEIAEGDVFNSSHDEEEDFETKGTVELVKDKGWCVKSDSLDDHIKHCHWFINWAQ